MSFLNKIRYSIYNPNFYSKIKSQSLGESLKYFFLLTLFLALINTSLLSYELVIKIPQSLKNFVIKQAAAFPENLKINIHQGRVSTDTGEPYFLPFPQDNMNDAYSGLNNILVIDTKTPFSLTQFDQYKTLFLLTSDSLFYRNREFETRSFSLSGITDLTIDRNFVQSLINQITPWLSFIGPVLLLIVFISLYIGFAFNLIYFLFLAVLVFFLGSIFKWGLNYSASYKIAIYSSTLSFLIDLILFNTGLYTGFFGFPFLFTLTSLCVATVNLQNFEGKS